MHPRYNIPHTSNSMQSTYYSNRPSSYSNYSRLINSSDDRFLLGGGFLGPFLLGGVAGSLISRPNYGYPPPPPVIYYPPVPVPYNNNYYYYR